MVLQGSYASGDMQYHCDNSYWEHLSKVSGWCNVCGRALQVSMVSANILKGAGSGQLEFQCSFCPQFQEVLNWPSPVSRTQDSILALKLMYSVGQVPFDSKVTNRREHLPVAVSLLACPGPFDTALACPFLNLLQVKIWNFFVTGKRAWKDLVDPPRFVLEMTCLVAKMTIADFDLTTCRKFFLQWRHPQAQFLVALSRKTIEIIIWFESYDIQLSYILNWRDSLVGAVVTVVVFSHIAIIFLRRVLATCALRTDHWRWSISNPWIWKWNDCKLMKFKGITWFVDLYHMQNKKWWSMVKKGRFFQGLHLSSI